MAAAGSVETAGTAELVLALRIRPCRSGGKAAATALHSRESYGLLSCGGRRLVGAAVGGPNQGEICLGGGREAFSSQFLSHRAAWGCRHTLTFLIGMRGRLAWALLQTPWHSSSWPFLTGNSCTMPKRARQYWLMKSEPDVFSIHDLLAAPKQQTFWDGVRNYQARNMLRDDIQVGDGVLYYHSNAKPPGVAGLAVVVGAGRPDPTQFDAKDAHFDPKSKPEEPRWYGVDLEGVLAFEELVSMQMLRDQPALAQMAVVQKGQRLSVQAVSAADWKRVLGLAGLKPSALPAY